MHQSYRTQTIRVKVCSQKAMVILRMKIGQAQCKLRISDGDKVTNQPGRQHQG